jgi:hypothetical protein
MARSDDRIDVDHAAMVLVDALLLGDKAAAAKHETTTRTIRNYRAKLKTNKQLGLAFKDAVDAIRVSWADDIPLAIKRSIAWFDRAMAEPISTLNADMWKAAAEYLKVLVDTQVMMQVINARLSSIGQSGQVIDADRPRITTTSGAGANDSGQ